MKYLLPTIFLWIVFTTVAYGQALETQMNIPYFSSLNWYKLINTHKVTATIYHATVRETDGTPFITADGTDVRKHKRILAVSRNMLTQYGGHLKFGDTVYVSGTGKLDGYWTVRDLMHKRYKNHIDFLVHKNIRCGKWYNVILHEVDEI